LKFQTNNACLKTLIKRRYITSHIMSHIIKDMVNYVLKYADYMLR